MNDAWIQMSARAARRATEQTIDATLKGSKSSVVSVLAARLPVVLAGVSGTWVVEFAAVLLKAIWQSEDTLKRVERTLTAVAREPMKTAFEQFRIATTLDGTDPDAIRHRQDRYRNCLFNLDRASSVASESEKVSIDLLRGLCALQVPGAFSEARLHLSSFVDAADGEVARLEEAAATDAKLAESLEIEASKIATSGTLGGGGGLAGMALAQPRLKRAELLQKANVARHNSVGAIAVAADLSIAAACVSSLFEGSLPS